MVEIAWSDLPDPPFRRKAAALTIGVFDGIHVGHRRLLHGITRDPDLLPIVVTFQRHPAEILASGSFPGFIMSLGQKRQALQAAGVEVAVLIDFSLEFSRLSCPDFLNQLLDSFSVRRGVNGHDFRCGHGVSMMAPAVGDHLRGRGVEVDIVEPVADDGGVVSSTRVRRAVAAGRLDEAHRLLGRPFTLDLTGEALERDGPEAWVALDGRRLLPESKQLVPTPGDYRVEVGDNGVRARTTLKIGENSIRLPLAADSRIRYIVLQENRIE